MEEKVIGNILHLAQSGDRAVQIVGVPKGDGGDQEVEAGRAVLLVFVGAVADFPEPMNCKKLGLTSRTVSDVVQTGTCRKGQD